MHAAALLLQLTVAVSAGAAKLDAATVCAATAEAARIWQPYLPIAFVDASKTAPPADVTVVITEATFSGATEESAGIGQIRFSEPGKPMNTIYLSATAARLLSASAHWKELSLEQTPARIRRMFLAHALGRALAHEIGHFLLRSTSHAPRGLMRARFLTPELVDEDLRPYALTAAQAADIRRSAALMAAGRPAASPR